MVNDITNIRKVSEGFYQAYLIKEDLEILLSMVEKGANLSKHNHEQTQFGYCFKGKFDFFVEEKKYEMEKGKSYLLPSNYYHFAKAKEDFYALDFKYISTNEYEREFSTDVLNINSISEDFIIKKIGFKNIQVNIVTAIHNDCILKVKELKRNTKLFIAVAEDVGIVINNSITVLQPMKIYEISTLDINEINILNKDKEIVLFYIEEN